MTVSPTNQAKHSVVLTNSTRNLANYQNIVRPGGSARYNQANFIYNQVADSASGQPVSYNTIGVLLVMTNQTKS